MADILIKVKDQAAKQCEKEIMFASEANLKELDVLRQLGSWNKDPNVRAAVIDDRPLPNGGKQFMAAFPILKKDTLEDVMKKYVKVFKWEYVDYMDAAHKMRELQDDRGFSKSGNMKLSLALPETLYSIIDAYFPQYLKTKKGVAALKLIIPKYFV